MLKLISSLAEGTEVNGDGGDGGQTGRKIEGITAIHSGVTNCGADKTTPKVKSVT